MRQFGGPAFVERLTPRWCVTRGCQWWRPCLTRQDNGRYHLSRLMRVDKKAEAGRSGYSADPQSGLVTVRGADALVAGASPPSRAAA
jgi:hypothetical protein